MVPIHKPSSADLPRCGDYLAPLENSGLAFYPLNVRFPYLPDLHAQTILENRYLLVGGLGMLDKGEGVPA